MSRSPNKLLASVPAKEYRRIASRLHTLRLSNATVLPHCGQQRVYFPGTGACSILRRMADGSTIEVASVGNEGAVGLPALGSQLSAGTYLQVSNGTVQYMTLASFEVLCVHSELGRAVAQFCGHFMESVMRLVACNRMHPVEARCARWILATHDRLQRANFELTQPFLAMAIGARGDELPAFMAKLAQGGVVRHDAATVTVIDPIALRRVACSCYAVLKKNAAASIEPRRTPRKMLETSNVVAMPGQTVCTLCGLGRDYPHRSHAECLHAIDAELRGLIGRVRHLTRQRRDVVAESMLKFEKFRQRRHS